MTSRRPILLAINDRLRVWWDGAYIPPDNRGNSGLVILQGHYEQHWTSRASHVALGYFKRIISGSSAWPPIGAVTT